MSALIAAFTEGARWAIANTSFEDKYAASSEGTIVGPSEAEIDEEAAAYAERVFDEEEQLLECLSKSRQQ